ncbi:cadherin domain-containing protein [Sunxiuqinia elliptica]|uniref:Putative secreted protein (Por secretion system target) n=1 Tax=Sunxiuqinia elliptica TaxID=655355 RepID=A0A4R6H5H9_9BACT|nr:cadherin domain-containing protein [Sunxiuqinia elliptica]TDO02665.1 putative secreted protein (Por secretion system target) [Sunxiuqinia elliptica]TDO58597.1 putative secreted protein (Por secretion system target) [Sunxiuqinia elliptica]
MKELILIILLALPATLLAQTSYYVSSSEGNDSNAGTSTSHPWKSLEKVNSFKPSAGDKILFKRGDEWEGTLVISASGTTGNPITYGAYGTGEKPRIYGSQEITGWQLHSGNIYKAKVTEDINQLFLNGAKMQVARFPNSGYATIDQVNSSTSFTSSSLPGGTNFTGAHLVIKTLYWFIDGKEVISSSGQSLTLNEAPTFNAKVGDEFVLVNSLGLLTNPGEWSYDSSIKTVYLRTPTDASPENYKIRGASYDYGINFSGQKYITIDNLNVLQVKNTGIRGINSSNININNSTIAYTPSYGIQITGGTECKITNNQLSYSQFEGMQVACSNSLITDNSLTAVLTEDGFDINTGTESGGPGRGIKVRGSSNIVRYNKLTNMGYVAIEFFGTNNIVEYNLIDGACKVIDDGGAIYTYNGYDCSQIGPAGTVVKNNIILNALGPSHKGYGIYMDNCTHDVIIEDNTISKTNCAIFLNHNARITVNGNTIMDATLALLNQKEVENSTITGNTFYATSRKGSFIWFKDAPQRMAFQNDASGIWNSNTYISPYKEDVFAIKGDQTFDYWKSSTGQDLNSSFDGTPLAEGETEQLFYNAEKTTKTISLGSSVYRDLNGNKVSGEIKLEPFTSIILIKTTQEIQNQSPVILDQSFNITDQKDAQALIGEVIANDPDDGQTLTYSIVTGNTDNLFSIEASTGVLVANSAITYTENQSALLTVEVKDNASNPLTARAQVTITIEINEPAQNLDTSSPVISAFTIPESSNYQTVAVTNLIASDNVGVTGYLLTESSTAPSASDNGWSEAVPSTYSFTSMGIQTLYAWAKDAAGNISESLSASVNIIILPPESAFSEYLFEENSGSIVIDSQGSNDGTLINEENRITGINGQGLEFSQTGHINLGQSFGDNVTDKLTLSAWIKPDAAQNTYQGIIMHGGPDTDSFALYAHPGLKRIGFRTAGTTNSWFAVDNLDLLWDGNWHLLTVTYDGAEKIIYLDDQVMGQINATGIIDSGAGYNLLIGAGRDENPATLLYDGAIDEVRIYNTVLSASDISDLFQRAQQIPTVENLAPTISPQSFAVEGDLVSNELIGQITASDPNEGQILTYTIVGGNEEALFAVDPSNGRIHTKSSILTTSNQTKSMTVQVTDNAATPLSAQAKVDINLIGISINHSPVIADQVFDLSDGVSVNDLVGTILATDPDEGQELNYSITKGNEDGLFVLDIANGELFLQKSIPLNAPETISLIVEVKDNAATPLAANATVIITTPKVGEINQAPVIADQTFKVNSSLKMNDMIGQILASDPNANDILSYSIIQGNQDGLFAVNSTTGELFANQDIALQTDHEVVLLVQVADNASTSLSASANITIQISATQINQSPIAQDLTLDLNGDIASNTVVGQLVASDPDQNQALSYRIASGNTEGLFSIDSSTGEIYAKSSILTTSPMQVNFVVEVSDNAISPLTTQANVTINIAAVQLNHSPAIADQYMTVEGDLPAGTFIGQIIASDPDAGQTLSYVILQGNEDGLFSLNPDNGQLFSNTEIAVTTNQSITLKVQVTDNDSNPLSAYANISISLIPTTSNQAPVVQNQLFEIRKNDKAGGLVGQIIASDPDQGQRLNYAIIQGNEDGSFFLDQTTGELFSTANLQLAYSQTLPLVVEVTDDATTPLSSTATITIDIVIKGKLVKGEVNNNDPKRIVLYYEEPLQADNLKSALINSDFETSNNKTVQKVSVKGNAIYLDVDSGYEFGDEILVSYTKGSLPIYDQSGNEIESFENFWVENNIMEAGISTDIDPDFKSLEVKFYPNPSNGIINILANNLITDNCEIAVFNMMGSMVSKQVLFASFGTLEDRVNLSHLNKGTYIMQLVCNTQVYQSKIVIM